MGLIGGIAGAVLGMRGGFLTSLIGSIIGSAIEDKIRGKSKDPSRIGSGTRPLRSAYRYKNVSAEKRAMIFCASAAAILAKMAKADGVVSTDEIASVEAAFQRLGFDRTARDYAVNVFRRAKDDTHTIYEYAAEFAAAVDSVQVRELFYELLWDLACADGNVSYKELAILMRIPFTLAIRPDWFEFYRRERLQTHGRSSSRSQSGGFASRDLLAEAYQILGVAASASHADVKKAYRDLAKKNHPDLLRAQGLPEEMIGRATEKMSRINSAWEAIKKSRGL